MYRVMDKYNGKQYGADCCSFEEAKCLKNEHEDAIICDLSIPKEKRAEVVRKAWEKLQEANINLKSCREEWLRLDQEYTALYGEEY